MASLIERVEGNAVVPLKVMCSMKWATPASSGVSRREPGQDVGRDGDRTGPGEAGADDTRPLGQHRPFEHRDGWYRKGPRRPAGRGGPGRARRAHWTGARAARTAAGATGPAAGPGGQRSIGPGAVHPTARMAPIGTRRHGSQGTLRPRRRSTGAPSGPPGPNGSRWAWSPVRPRGWLTPRPATGASWRVRTWKLRPPGSAVARSSPSGRRRGTPPQRPTSASGSRRPCRGRP